MTIASWLVKVDKGRGASVRSALARPGVECRSEAYDTLVVVSETGPEGLAALQRDLSAAPGVQDVALVARFEDDLDERGPARRAAAQAAA